MEDSNFWQANNDYSANIDSCYFNVSSNPSPLLTLASKSDGREANFFPPSPPLTRSSPRSAPSTRPR